MARLVLVGAAASDKAAPESLLQETFNALREAGVQVQVLLTPAGFLREKSTGPWFQSRGWKSRQQSFDDVAEIARKAVISMFTPHLRRSASAVTRDVIFGVDVGMALSRHEAHAEVSIRYSPATGKSDVITGKSYPTIDQERMLIREVDVGTHLYGPEQERVGVLVCHDLMSFSPRSRKNRNGMRASVGDELGSLVNHNPPRIVLHQAHTVSSRRTWAAAWNTLRREAHPATWATSFRYLTKGERTPNGPLTVPLLEATRSADTIDIVIR